MAVTAGAIGLWSARSRAIGDRALGPQRHTAPASGRSRPSSRTRHSPFTRMIRQPYASWPGHRHGLAVTPPPRPSISAGSMIRHSKPKIIFCWGYCTTDRVGRTLRRKTGKKCSMPGSYRRNCLKSSLVFRSRHIAGTMRSWRPSGSADNLVGRRGGP